MKKQFALSLLAAAAVAPAFAQSSVTAYGRLNVTLERQDANGAVDKGVFDNASRIGFKGTEDLGSGLKAGFVLEHGFNPATGQQKQAAFWARQSEVNLSGSFGMIRAGNFTSEAYFATADYVSMHNHDTGSSSDALYAYPVANTKKVSYRTPTFGGFNAELAVGEANANGGERGYDLAANYDAGALHLGAGYDKAGAAKQFAVRALYELGAFTVGGYVQRDSDAWGLAGSRTNFRLSGMYTMGATELHLNLGKAGDIGNNADTGATQWTVGVNQNLSKRTKVYAYYTKVSADVANPYAGDFNSLAVGVRHNF